MPHSLVRGLIGVVALGVPLVAEAGSFALNEQSVSGLGTAYAGGAAQAEDASTLFFNPAGIAWLDQGALQIGAHGLLPSATFTNEGSRYNLRGTPFNGLPISGGNDGDGGVDHVLPNLYLTQPILRGSQSGDLTLGIGVTVPFALETDYSPGWVGRYHALRSKLTTFNIQPTVAYRIWDRLSFGAGLDIQYASARLTQAIDFGLAAQPPLAQFFAALPPFLRGPTELAYFNAGFFPGALDGVSEVHGDDWSVGFTLGALVEYMKGDGQSFFQDGRFGVSFRSAIDHAIEGPADFRRVPLITAPGALVQFPIPGLFQRIFFDQNATAQLDLPSILHVSAYQRFDRQFAVLGDITWTEWSRLQEVPIVFSNPGTPSNVLPIKYEDTIRAAIGGEWYATEDLTLRLGFAYDETPIRSNEFRTPRIPDNNRFLLGTGLRWSPTHFMDIDVGYAHLFVDEPRVDVTDSQGHELRGKFDAAADIVSAAVTFRWGGPHESTPVSSKDVLSYKK
ncbi:MAG TPA: outer membrane protein transport protein [Chthoniobacterales bacterium]|nr:outer membrane protein transport protein [Chthoniobacterales bacterium]